MKKLFSGFKKASRSPRRGPDDQFGTGLWRHNRDRFIRAVDRYYTTASAIHDARASAPKPGTASAKEDASNAANTRGDATLTTGITTDSAANTIIDGTHRLNELVPIVDEITAWLHTHHPVTGQVVPSHTRSSVGSTPELLTKASSKVAEAVLAASMARTELLAGRMIGSSAQASERFITDAAQLLEQAWGNLDRVDGP